MSTDENGKADFDKLTENLETTLINTKLVFKQVRQKEKAMYFPIYTAFGIGLYALTKITGKKKFHRKGEEHGSARWANKKEIAMLADKPQKKKKGEHKVRDQPKKKKTIPKECLPDF